MKKLSELMAMAIDISPVETPIPFSPTIVLFDGVLNGEKVLLSPEIKTLVNHFFGAQSISVIQIENDELLHGWLRDEQYKADVQNRVWIYPVKADNGDLILNTHNGQYAGPLYIQIFSPGEITNTILTITCNWSDELFKNDYYVVGAIIDHEDLDAIINSIAS